MAAGRRGKRVSGGGSELVIRRPSPEEYPEIDRLIEESYAHDYGPSDPHDDPVYRSAVRDRDYEVWVAVDADGRLLGSVTLRAPGGPPLHEDVAERELDLRLLGVAPSARRRGVAAALMRQAAVRAAETGRAAVVLKTAPNMRGAHRLYEALEFSRAPERDGLWIDGERVLDLYTYVFPLHEACSATWSTPSCGRG